jgi:hypothetical protein
MSSLAQALFASYGGGGAPASFPVIEATQTSGDSTSLTSRDVTLPSGIVSGDLLVVQILMNVNNLTITGGNGWTEAFNATSGGADRHAVVWKIAAGSDVLNISSTAARFSAIAYRISGADSFAIQATTGQFTTYDPPALTPGAGTKKYMWITGASRVSDSNIPSSGPTDFTNLITRQETNQSVWSWRRELEASTLDPNSYAVTNSRRSGIYTIAVWQS